VLKELVEHHIREEERDFFKKARKLFDKRTMEQMGEEMEAEKLKEMGGASETGRTRRRASQAEARAER
jgi:hypothetical protein